MKGKFLSRSFFWLLLISPLFPVSVARAQEADKLAEGARKEGKLKLGISIRYEVSGKPVAKKLVQAFESRYPFVKVEYERVGTSRERERVLAELASGRVPYDVSVLADDQVSAALQANLVERIDWRSLGVHAQHVDPRGFGVNYRSLIYGIVVNKKLVPDSVGKNFTWQDCANPKWRGKVAMDTRPRHLEILWHVWGRDKTLDHARQLAANQTIYEQDWTAALTKLSLGEFSILCGAVYPAYNEQVVYRAAHNLGFTVPDPAPVATGSVVFIPRKVAHPNAARLWVLWSLSEEGQKALDAVDSSGSPLFPGTGTAKLLQGKNIAWYEAAWREQAQETLTAIVKSLGLPIAP